MLLCLNQTSPLFRLADSSVTKPDFHVRHCRCIICDLLCCEIKTVQLCIRRRKGWPATPGPQIQAERNSSQAKYSTCLTDSLLHKRLVIRKQQTKKAGSFLSSIWNRSMEFIPQPPCEALFLSFPLFIRPPLLSWVMETSLVLSQVMCLFSRSHLLVYGGRPLYSLSLALLSPVLSRGILAAEILFTTYRF